MGMNFSPRWVYPMSSRADDDYTRSMCHRSSEGFGTTYRLNCEADGVYDSLGEADASYDLADLLPSDPFGMELSSTFTAAIAGWIGDYRVGLDDFEAHDDELLAGLHYYWNRALEPPLSEPFDGGCMEGEEEFSGLSGHVASDGVTLYVDEEEVSSSGGNEAACSYGQDGVLHEGLLFSLGYLGVKHLGVRNLLSLEMVCRSLHSAVQSDSFLWRCIHIDSPLSEKITDDTLLRLTQRAHGNLQCLSLVVCSRITDDGLKRVLECNPRLKKLGVPGCVRLTIEGLINNLKAFMSSGMSGVKHLKLGRILSVSPGHFEELKLLVDGDYLQQNKPRKARFYNNRPSYSPVCEDDERAIDIEMCPRCQKCKLVFDCPSESCQQKGPEECRACDICIMRCVPCGRCINNCIYEETFCLENLCLDCYKSSQSPEGLVDDE